MKPWNRIKQFFRNIEVRQTQISDEYLQEVQEKWIDDLIAPIYMVIAKNHHMPMSVNEICKHFPNTPKKEVVAALQRSTSLQRLKDGRYQTKAIPARMIRKPYGYAVDPDELLKNPKVIREVHQMNELFKSTPPKFPHKKSPFP